MLCHKSGTYQLPLAAGLLPTTVRTTQQMDGADATVAAAELAFQAVGYNLEDWVNSPTASTCFYCHTSSDAMAHMMQNGALLSWPALPLTMSAYSNRDMYVEGLESCSVCHGPGKSADLELVHNK